MDLQGNSSKNLASYVLLFHSFTPQTSTEDYHTQDPREANVSSVVSIPPFTLADSLVSFLICQMKKIGSQDDAMR